MKHKLTLAAAAASLALLPAIAFADQVNYSGDSTVSNFKIAEAYQYASITGWDKQAFDQLAARVSDLEAQNRQLQSQCSGLSSRVSSLENKPSQPTAGAAPQTVTVYQPAPVPAASASDPRFDGLDHRVKVLEQVESMTEVNTGGAVAKGDQALALIAKIMAALKMK